MFAVIGLLVACLACGGLGFAVGILLRATGDVTVTEYRACPDCGRVEAAMSHCPDPRPNWTVSTPWSRLKAGLVMALFCAGMAGLGYLVVWLWVRP